MRSGVALATTFWTREFWSELVNRSSSLRRRDNEAELWGWKIRLVWDDGGRRGVVYLHRDAVPRNVKDAQGDLRTFVFTNFDPRKEARLLLDQLYSADAPRRRSRT